MEKIKERLRLVMVDGFEDPEAYGRKDRPTWLVGEINDGRIPGSFPRWFDGINNFTRMRLAFKWEDIINVFIKDDLLFHMRS